jgi:hypothetical protein
MHSSNSAPDVAPFKPLKADDVDGFYYRNKIERNDWIMIHDRAHCITGAYGVTKGHNNKGTNCV